MTRFLKSWILLGLTIECLSLSSLQAQTPIEFANAIRETFLKTGEFQSLGSFTKEEHVELILQGESAFFLAAFTRNKIKELGSIDAYLSWIHSSQALRLMDWHPRDVSLNYEVIPEPGFEAILNQDHHDPDSDAEIVTELEFIRRRTDFRLPVEGFAHREKPENRQSKFKIPLLNLKVSSSGVRTNGSPADRDEILEELISGRCRLFSNPQAAPSDSIDQKTFDLLHFFELLSSVPELQPNEAASKLALSFFDGMTIRERSDLNAAFRAGMVSLREVTEPRFDRWKSRVPASSKKQQKRQKRVPIDQGDEFAGLLEVDPTRIARSYEDERNETEKIILAEDLIFAARRAKPWLEKLGLTNIAGSGISHSFNQNTPERQMGHAKVKLTEMLTKLERGGAASLNSPKRDQIQFLSRMIFPEIFPEDLLLYRRLMAVDKKVNSAYTDRAVKNWLYRSSFRHNFRQREANEIFGPFYREFEDDLLDVLEQDWPFNNKTLNQALAELWEGSLLLPVKLGTVLSQNLKQSRSEIVDFLIRLHSPDPRVVGFASSSRIPPSQFEAILDATLEHHPEERAKILEAATAGLFMRPVADASDLQDASFVAATIYGYGYRNPKLVQFLKMRADKYDFIKRSLTLGGAYGEAALEEYLRDARIKFLDPKSNPNERVSALFDLLKHDTWDGEIEKTAVRLATLKPGMHEWDVLLNKLIAKGVKDSNLVDSARVVLNDNRWIAHPRRQIAAAEFLILNGQYREMDADSLAYFAMNAKDTILQRRAISVLKDGRILTPSVQSVLEALHKSEEHPDLKSPSAAALAALIKNCKSKGNPSE